MLRQNFRTAIRHAEGTLPTLAVGATLLFALVVIGSLFFIRGQRIMETQLKDKLQSTAAAAAMQFDGAMIEKIQDGDMMQTSKPLGETVAKLVMLKDTVTNIRSAYIMRKTDNPAELAFVADADMALSESELDRNKNGVIESDEESPVTGETYDWSDSPQLGHEAFLHPTVDTDITTDQWGSTISGYAPVYTKSGEIVATMGIDMEADEFKSLSQSIFSPVALLLVLLAALSIGGSIMLSLWRKRMETLERLEIERSGLLRLAFHQLGGPLTIISWSIEELQETGPQSMQRTITNIQEGVKRLTNILHTLKEADLVHSGKIDYKPEFVSLSAILKDVIRDAGTELAARRQHVTMDLAENVTMKLDPKLIAGSAREILMNAIGFSPDGAEIIVRSNKSGKRAIFEIQDHGCGIPKRDLGRIFQEFTRGSNASKFKADGNGLGLYIVNGVVTRAGGRISVKSEENKGTTVIVDLPMAHHP